MISHFIETPFSMVPYSSLVRVSITVKIHHDHGNSDKKKIYFWLITVPEAQPIIIMVIRMTVCRSMWCCGKNRTFYILIHKQLNQTKYHIGFRQGNTLPHSDTSSKHTTATPTKATAPNTATPFRPSIQILCDKSTQSTITIQKIDIKVLELSKI